MEISLFYRVEQLSLYCPIIEIVLILVMVMVDNVPILSRILSQIPHASILCDKQANKTSLGCTYRTSASVSVAYTVQRVHTTPIARGVDTLCE